MWGVSLRLSTWVIRIMKGGAKLLAQQPKAQAVDAAAVEVNRRPVTPLGHEAAPLQAANGGRVVRQDVYKRQTIIP